MDPIQLAQLGKHIKVVELLSEKYRCQIDLLLLSAQVLYVATHHV